MIGAVILAAGESRRMGENKLLLKIGGQQVIERVANSFKSVADKIIVVLGHRPEDLIPALKELGVGWTVNPNYEEGMVSSFKRGLKEIRDCGAAFLALGDQPFVDPDFLRRAIEAWKNGAKMVSPVHKGKKGHPVLFDRSLFDEVLSLRRHEFIRDVIHRHSHEHHLVGAGEWAITDLDTPEGFRRVLGKGL